MSHVGAIDCRPVVTPDSFNGVNSDRNVRAERRPSHVDPRDQVALSRAARAFDADLDGLAQRRIARIRAEIAADTYLTDDKIDAVVERLWEKLAW